MKKLMLATVMLAGVCVLGGENLLKNPGFETKDAKKYSEKDQYRSETLEGWAIADWGGNPKDGSNRGKVGLKSHSEAVEGEAGGCLYTTGEKRGNLLIYQSVTLTPGKEQNYLLTFKFKKADPKDENQISVFASYLTYMKDAETGKNKRLAYKHAKRVIATDEWQTIEFPFTVSADASILQIMLRANNGGVVFDDAVLTTQD